MRLLAALLLAPLLTGCLATQGALSKLNLAIGDASVAALEAKNRAEDVNATQADIDESMAALMETASLTTDALEAVQDAVLADIESAKGITGLGMGMDGGAIGLALTGLAWWMRDRRKRLGQDPLQRSDVPTPPTTVA